MNLDPKDVGLIVDMLVAELMSLFNSLPPAVQDAVRAHFQALMAALFALRTALTTGEWLAALRTLAAALRAFVTALGEAGVAASGNVAQTLATIEAQVASVAEGAAGAAAEGAAGSAAEGAAGGAATGGAGGTAGVVLIEVLWLLLLWLLAILAWMRAIKEISEARGPVAKPVGGPLCGDGMPVARGLTVANWSWWGEASAFKAALEDARATAQAQPCPRGGCTSGSCRGNCAVRDIAYGYRVLWTTCTITFDVYCECY